MDEKRISRIVRFVGYSLLGLLTVGSLHALLLYPGGQRIFGAVYVTMGTPYYQILNDELRAAIERGGDRLLTRDPQNDTARAVQEIHEMIDRRVDGLFVCAVNDPDVDAAIAAARAAGIPVLALNTPRADGDAVDCTVTSDNTGLGEMCARDLMARRESARVLILRRSGLISMEQRADGFAAALAQAEGFEVAADMDCENVLDAAQTCTREAIAAGLEFDTVFAVSDNMAIGALEALAECGRLQEVQTYGVNGSPDAKLLISEGTMTGSAAQHPGRIAQIAAARMYDLAEGRTAAPVNEVTGTMIHPDNVMRFGLTDWQ